MPPDLANEQPRLDQQYRQQGLPLAVPGEEHIDFVADQASHSNSRKHEQPEDFQSGTVKRTKLSNDNENPTRKPVIIPRKKYGKVIKLIDHIREAVTENRQKLETMYEENKATELELANVKKALSNARRDSSHRDRELEW